MIKKSESLTSLFSKSLNETNLSQKQKQVLIASLYLFSQKGFYQTSTVDIAKMAGVAEGSVYRQFKTKEGLLRQILQPFIVEVIPRAMHQFTKRLEEDPYPSFEIFIYSMMKDRMDFVLDNILQIRVVAEQVLRDKSLLGELGKLIETSMIKPLAPIFYYYQQRGDLVNWPVERIVKYILSINLSYLLPVILNSNVQFDRETSCQEASDFLLKGLSAKG